MSDMGFSSDEQRELIGDFLAEAEEHLSTLNDRLLEAEGLVKEGAQLSDDAINQMFRAAHTIKGTASFIGLDKIAGLTHEMETILQKVRAKEMTLSLPMIDALFKGVDLLGQMMAGLKEKGQEAGEIGEVAALLKDILSGGQAQSSDEKKGAENPMPAASGSQQQGENAGQEGPAAKDIEPIEFDFENINEKYLEQFILDALQNVDDFNEGLLSFEDDRSNKDIVNRIFRVMHTLKGSAGLVNVTPVQKLAHAMEDLLSIGRERPDAIDDDAISLLYKGIDAIKALIDNLRVKEPAGKDAAVLCAQCRQKYTDIKEGRQTQSAAKADKLQAQNGFSLDMLTEKQKQLLKDLISKDNDIFLIKVKAKEDATLPEMKIVLAKERLLKKTVIVLCHPPEIESEDPPSGLTNGEFLVAADIDERDIRSLLSIDGIIVESIERIDLSKLRGVLDMSETTTASTVPQEKDSRPGQQKVKPQGGVETSSIRINTAKLDNLMNLSGELVILRARFAQLFSMLEEEVIKQKAKGRTIEELSSILDDFSRELRKKFIETEENKKVLAQLDAIKERFAYIIEQELKSELPAKVHMLDELTSGLGKLSSEIQTGVMQTRMIPVEGVFSRFKRVVRDLAKDLGKEIVLQVKGEETELDKKIVDSLGDPLTHMIRNAIDHGIESPQDRAAKGKPPYGTVMLRAMHKGSNICIEVSDDGKGMDADKIGASALKKGLINEEDLAKMTTKEKLEMIFWPGFSTAEKVSNISGRGVGMDVVKAMIDSVNGTVSIESEVDKGTTFTLKIPLTLAIIQVLLVHTEGQILAIPLESVNEVLKVKDEEIFSIDKTRTIKLRGHALSILSIAEVLGIKEENNSKDEASGESIIVVLTDGEEKIGYTVDKLIGEEEIVIKALTDHFANVKGISGASVLGDGSISLIVDPMIVIKESRKLMR